MNAGALIQLAAAALLIATGLMNLFRAPRAEDETGRRNSRLSGWLFLAAGGLFLILALGFNA